MLSLFLDIETPSHAAWKNNCNNEEDIGKTFVNNSQLFLTNLGTMNEMENQEI